jgi:hypothetical protein
MSLLKAASQPIGIFRPPPAISILLQVTLDLSSLSLLSAPLLVVDWISDDEKWNTSRVC